MCMCIQVYTHVSRERERERERDAYMCVHAHDRRVDIHTDVHTDRPTDTQTDIHPISVLRFWISEDNLNSKHNLNSKII